MIFVLKIVNNFLGISRLHNLSNKKDCVLILKQEIYRKTRNILKKQKYIKKYLGVLLYDFFRGRAKKNIEI